MIIVLFTKHVYKKYYVTELLPLYVQHIFEKNIAIKVLSEQNGERSMHYARSEQNLSELHIMTFRLLADFKGFWRLEFQSLR